MSQFEDYHRTVVGYHGTGLSSALRIVNRVENFRLSRKDYNWLGHGIYFWEYAPKQALEWAEIRQRQYLKKRDKSAYDQQRATEPLAVVACMIRLGNCLDLTEPENIKFISEVFQSYRVNLDASSQPLPRNHRKYRKLDCAVFEYAYEVLEHNGPVGKVDTVRGIYVLQDGAKRVWEGSWISQDTHVQLCVRKPSNILGAWLHFPSRLGANDVCRILQPAVDEQASSSGPQAAPNDVEI